IVRKGTPEYDRYRQPSHINCRRIMVDIGRDEVGPDGLPTRPDEIPLEDVHALEQKYGHFHVDPSKYAELRIPSRPEARDFTYVRGAKGEPGHLSWMPGLPKAPLQQTLRDMWELAIEAGTPADALAMTCTRLVSAAGEHGLYNHLAHDFAKHATEWGQSLGTLDDDVYAALAKLVADDPSTRVCTRDYHRRQVIGLHNARLQVGARHADDVGVVYDPATAEIIHVMRVTRGGAYFEKAEGFRRLRWAT
ncbi:MAG: hypothetical protein ABFE07_02015, partial [Armatimonadia bacterium]